MKGKELRRLRKGRQLTQRAFAAEVGVHPNTWARYERDDLSIPEPVARLARLLSGAADHEPRAAARPRRGRERGR
jgi:transcriptional regulator with XRE-family HTH domain